MRPDAAATLLPIKDWLVAQGLVADDPEAFVGELGRRLASLLPLARLTIGASTLDPNIRGMSLTWTDAGDVLFDSAPNTAEGEAMFRLSPIHFVQAQGLMDYGWHLAAGEGIEAHPLLARLAAEAAIAHYAVKLVAFPNEPHVRGMAFTVATREPGGFSAADHAFLDALLPAIGLVTYRLLLSELSREMLRIYVGPRTGERVLAGLVRRGEGEAIDAAVFFADLKGFTALSERLSPPEVVAVLDERFDLLDAPIARHGGEILKFMGDGLLAVFPFAPDAAARVAACGRALAAAREALSSNDAANRLRVGTAPVGLDVALHVGEVFYGNIGAARRLDFTVIGPAVNLASRIEGLCDELGRNLVMTQAFAECCGAATVPLGCFPLKGIAAPQAVFGTADGV